MCPWFVTTSSVADSRATAAARFVVKYSWEWAWTISAAGNRRRSDRTTDGVMLLSSGRASSRWRTVV